VLRADLLLLGGSLNGNKYAMEVQKRSARKQSQLRSSVVENLRYVNMGVDSNKTMIQ